MRKFVYTGCAFLVFLGLLAFGFFAGAEVVPPKIEYEYATIEKQVTVPCPTSTPMPTYTPVVKTLEGKECPPCPTPILSSSMEYLPAYIDVYSYFEDAVDVYSSPHRGDNSPERVGLLRDGTPVYILAVRQGECYIVFDAAWGNDGWVACEELTDEKERR